MVFLLLQFYIGTQFRELIDHFYTDSTGIKEFLDQKGGFIYTFHNFLAFFLLLISYFSFYKSSKIYGFRAIKTKINIILSIIISFQYLSGILNIEYSFPTSSQVIHIWFGSIIFTLLLYVCIMDYRSKKII